MPRGKQSGINYGQRHKQRGQSDAETLVAVKRYLFKRYKIRWIKIHYFILYYLLLFNIPSKLILKILNR